jgi:hypothetical protein
MKVKNGSGPPNVVAHVCPQNLPTEADLIPSPDDGLNSYNSPQLSVEVGVTSYGRGYVTIDIQL